MAWLWLGKPTPLPGKMTPMPPRRGRRSYRIRPALEPLEDRTVPSITGLVFQDFNANGAFDTAGSLNNSGTGTIHTAVDHGLAGVAVTAYNAAGAAAATAVTAANGTFTLAGTAAGQSYRVEFTNLPAGFSPGPHGANDGTTVQFVNGGASNVDLGLVQPATYSVNNPLLVTSQYWFGNPQTGPNANQADPGGGDVLRRLRLQRPLGLHLGQLHDAGPANPGHRPSGRRHLGRDLRRPEPDGVRGGLFQKAHRLRPRRPRGDLPDPDYVQSGHGRGDGRHADAPDDPQRRAERPRHERLRHRQRQHGLERRGPNVPRGNGRVPGRLDPVRDEPLRPEVVRHPHGRPRQRPGRHVARPRRRHRGERRRPAALRRHLLQRPGLRRYGQLRREHPEPERPTRLRLQL